MCFLRGGNPERRGGPRWTRRRLSLCVGRRLAPTCIINSSSRAAAAGRKLTGFKTTTALLCSVCDEEDEGQSPLLSPKREMRHVVSSWADEKGVRSAQNWLEEDGGWWGCLWGRRSFRELPWKQGFTLERQEPVASHQTVWQKLKHCLCKNDLFYLWRIISQLQCLSRWSQYDFFVLQH